MAQPWLAVGVGLASGVLSGMFGVGGGVLTTPAIRLLLGGSAMSAIATPLPVIIPTAVTGAVSYARRGSADVRAGAMIGAYGAAAAVAGAFAAGRIGGTPLLLVTAALIGYVAVDMAIFAFRAEVSGGVAGELGAEPALVAAGAGRGGANGAAAYASPSAARLAIAGVAAGLYSGLLGLGGGFVVVPLLARWLRMPMKRAIGTSLVAVGLLAVPGSVTHGLLGHIDWRLAAALAAGVVPGALVGARVTAAASERAVRIGFAAFLLAAAALLAANEVAVLSR